MKTKIKYILRLLVVAVLLFEVAEPVAAQSRANNRKGKKEKTTSSQSAQIVKLKAIILDEEGKPVQNVVLFSGENTGIKLKHMQRASIGKKEMFSRSVGSKKPDHILPKVSQV